MWEWQRYLSPFTEENIVLVAVLMASAVLVRPLSSTKNATALTTSSWVKYKFQVELNFYCLTTIEQEYH